MVDICQRVPNGITLGPSHISLELIAVRWVSRDSSDG